jgi:hypothetical protein
VWLVHKADSLTAIYEPIVQTMWDLQHVTTLLLCIIGLLVNSFALLYFAYLISPAA